jgi:hypothetical protein
MAPATVLARRLLHRIGRLADGMDELPLVLAISIGGFYVSILAVLALASPPTAEARATVPSDMAFMAQSMHQGYGPVHEQEKPQR